MIHDIEAFHRGTINWDEFSDAVFGDGSDSPTRIKATDVDGSYERYGNFLNLEHKSPGKPVDTGQLIYITNIIKAGAHTYVVLWGIKDGPGINDRLIVEAMQIWYPGKRLKAKERETHPKIQKACNADWIDFGVRWRAWAERNRRA